MVDGPMRRRWVDPIGGREARSLGRWTHREESLVNLGALARASIAVRELRLELRGGEGGSVVAPGGGLEEREGIDDVPFGKK